MRARIGVGALALGVLALAAAPGPGFPARAVTTGSASVGDAVPIERPVPPGPSPAGRGVGGATQPADLARYYRLLSSPDFLNADVADLAGSRWAYWHDGLPNSWNSDHAVALDTVLEDWASFGPDAVSVPGDLVNGRWLRDPDHTGIFGPMDTPGHRRSAVVRAGRTYYSAWRQRFAEHDLVVYPGIGDHDLGDNPWRGRPILDEKRRLAPVFRRVFAAQLMTRPDGSPRFGSRPVGSPWEATAYALRPRPEVQLVMLDVFRTSRGDIVPEVTGRQLSWLERVLAAARSDGVDWIVVQGHTPIVGPVRLGPSSGLMYRGGSSSPLWSLFRRYGVDVYLCGEVHASTAVVRDGVVQLSHGGNVGHGGSATSRGGTSFVVSDFSSADLDMTLYSWDRERDGGELWQLGENRIPEVLRFLDAPVAIGRVRISNNGASTRSHPTVLDRSGLFAPFDPAAEDGAYAVEALG